MFVYTQNKNVFLSVEYIITFSKNQFKTKTCLTVIIIYWMGGWMDNNQDVLTDDLFLICIFKQEQLSSCLCDFKTCACNVRRQVVLVKGPGRGRGLALSRAQCFIVLRFFHKFYNINSCYRSFLFFCYFSLIIMFIAMNCELTAVLFVCHLLMYCDVKIQSVYYFA